jgi:hypothetical protein
MLVYPSGSQSAGANATSSTLSSDALQADQSQSFLGLACSEFLALQDNAQIGPASRAFEMQVGSLQHLNGIVVPDEEAGAHDPPP